MIKLRTAAVLASPAFVQSSCMLRARAQQLTPRGKAPVGDAPVSSGPLAVDWGWRGLAGHIDGDGRLGAIQPVGAYAEDTSYVYGVSGFLLTGSGMVQIDTSVSRHRGRER